MSKHAHSHAFTRRVFGAALSAALVFASAAIHAETAPRVQFNTTAGAFTVELYPDKAPKTSRAANWSIHPCCLVTPFLAKSLKGWTW